MSLGTSRPLFTQAWVDGLRASVESAMVATITIYVVVGEPAYNPTTDTWTESRTTYYTGKARIQPIRSTQVAEAPGNTSSIQGVRVQIPVTELSDDLRPGMRLDVTASPLNATLLDFSYVISDVVDSSNPIERTLEAKIDQEVHHG